MRFAYRWSSRFNSPASWKVKLWIWFRNKESLFAYCEMILSVGTWSNPMKLPGRYTTTQSAPIIPHLNLLDCKVQNRLVVLSQTKALEYVDVYTENILKQVILIFKRGGSWPKNLLVMKTKLVSNDPMLFELIGMFKKYEHKH